MGRNYKTVRNGKSTELIVKISTGAEGTDIIIRGDGKVLAFDGWNDLVWSMPSMKIRLCTVNMIILMARRQWRQI